MAKIFHHLGFVNNIGIVYDLKLPTSIILIFHSTNCIVSVNTLQPYYNTVVYSKISVITQLLILSMYNSFIIMRFSCNTNYTLN